MAKKPIYKFIDLFAGIGGFHVAFNNTKRAQCVFASEWDPAARKTYRHNFNHGADKALFANDDKYFQGDITKVDPKSGIPAFDILCGGFPCQPFSQAGHKKGFSDTRGTLFFNVEEIIRVKQPAAFFLENVRGLITHGGPSETVPGIGKTMETILNHLFGDKKSGGLGYHKPKGFPGYFFVKASDFGVPQHRPRVFIIGFKSKKSADEFIVPAPQKLDEMRLGEILGGEVFFDRACKKRKSIGFTLRCGGKGSPIEDRRNWEHYHVLKRRTDDPEVVKINETHGLRLNGFPEFYQFPSDVGKSARMKQLGNSVAVSAVEAWGRAIIEALDTSPIKIGSVKIGKAAIVKRKEEGKSQRKNERKKNRKKKTQNKGEKGEILVKVRLGVALYRQENIPGFGKIRQVGLGDLKGRKGVYRYEQREAASGFIEVQEQAQVAGLDDVLMRKLERMGVSKSSHLNKADVRINDVLASVKMGRVGKSSLINHQARSGFISIFGVNSDAFRLLDAEVLRYIDLRRGALITEDVGWGRRKEMNLFINDSFKDAFRVIFDYFVFDGSVGFGPSRFPAQSVILVDDAFDPLTWNSFSRADFYDHCWGNLVFSLRRHSKANFTSEDEPWVLLSDDGKPKGQLSLRI